MKKETTHLHTSPEHDVPEEIALTIEEVNEYVSSTDSRAELVMKAYTTGVLRTIKYFNNEKKQEKDKLPR